MRDPQHPDPNALAGELLGTVGRLQMALQVAYELAVRGPGTAGQIADRMEFHDDERGPVRTEWVEEAFDELDNWSLLDIQGLEDSDPIGLVGRGAA